MKFENLSIETLEKIADVFSLIEDHVGATLGPDGKNVLIKRSGEKSFVTKDGVTVMTSITFPETMAEESAIANIISDMSKRTDAVVGDGTTSTVVYANSLFQQLLKHKKLGTRTAGLLQGAKRATNEAVRLLGKYAYTVTAIEEIERIANLSSNGDKQISGILSKAFEEIGKDGSIILNDSNAPKPFKIKIQNGFSMHSGLLTRYFINNEQKRTCEVSNPLILVTDYGITNIEPLLSIMGKVAEESKPLVIVCDYVDGTALQAIIENSTRKNMIRVYVLTTSEYFGPKKKALFEDIALFTGAKFVTKALGHDIQDLIVGDLGTAERIEISIKSSVVVNGAGDSAEVTKHVDFLKEQLSLVEQEEEIAEFNSRILRFGSGVAEIFIGGSTEAEVKEKRFRIDDALMAINSALTKGFVAGGGTTFIALSGELEKILKSEKKNMSDEEYAGYKSVVISLHSILNRLLRNSELDYSNAGNGESFSSLGEINGERIREKIIKGGKSGIGFNFRTKKFAKFIDKENPSASVIEPALIVENVLSNALSIVTLLLNTERLVCRI